MLLKFFSKPCGIYSIAVTYVKEPEWAKQDVVLTAVVDNPPASLILTHLQSLRHLNYSASTVDQMLGGIEVFSGHHLDFKRASVHLCCTKLDARVGGEHLEIKELMS